MPWILEIYFKLGNKIYASKNNEKGLFYTFNSARFSEEHESIYLRVDTIRKMDSPRSYRVDKIDQYTVNLLRNVYENYEPQKSDLWISQMHL